MKWIVLSEIAAMAAAFAFVVHYVGKMRETDRET